MIFTAFKVSRNYLPLTPTETDISRAIVRPSKVS